MSEWAERECRIVCGIENPNYDFDSNDFDYGCSCYKSALKAYKSLMEDGHSGASFGFTKNILIRLMEGQPLTPITDEDFFEGENLGCLESDEYLKERGLKSHIQCPRISSLFRKETLDGKVTYHDVDRSYFVDIENPSNTYLTDDSFLDEMFPITMPYVPQKEKYKIYAQEFLTDKKNGDFDTRGLIYMITPSGERMDLNLYYTEIDGKWTQIMKAQYDELLAKRIDKLSEKVADKLIWTLLSNSSDEEESERRNAAYNKMSDEWKVKVREKLIELCKFFEYEENYKYNTFKMEQKLCKGEASIVNWKETQYSLYEGESDLEKIAEFMTVILETLNNKVVTKDDIESLHKHDITLKR